VSVSGLTPSAYEPRDDASSSFMPMLQRLARAGVSADLVATVAPASAYPAHATLVTGETPARHGVPADHLLGENGVRSATYSHASFLRVPTLWQRAREARLSVAAFDWPSTVGAAIDLLIPDVAPVRRDESWVRLLADTSTPWLAERVRSSGAGELPGPGRDALLTDLVCEVLGASASPALVLLRYSQTERPLSLSGPDSPEAREAFRAVDLELERLVECLRRGGQLADTAILVVGDRGFLPVHTQVHPNRQLAESGLLTARGSTPWKAISRSNGGSAFVYAKDENSAVVARNVLEELAERTRAFRVVPAREMLDSGADPEAWFALDALPGTVFSDAGGHAVVEPAALRGAGGYLGAPSGLEPGFVAWGQGLRQGVRIPWMRQSDVAPTVAALLRLDLAPEDGRPLVGALALPMAGSVGAPRRP
jgi:predicted AlkP superfamily pyrophosphatase or phosphodiesterase